MSPSAFRVTVMGDVSDASMHDADRANVNVKVMGVMDSDDMNTRSWELA
jgi:hypothetical protein